TGARIKGALGGEGTTPKHTHREWSHQPLLVGADRAGQVVTGGCGRGARSPGETERRPRARSAPPPRRRRHIVSAAPPQSADSGLGRGVGGGCSVDLGQAEMGGG